jgi:uncharacterized phage protein (TIGR02220 family)
LWHTVLEQAEDGDLTNWGNEFIAAAAQWKGDPEKFCKALRDNRWLDGHLIHDWLDYAGRYLESRYRTSHPERLKQIADKHKANGSQTKGCPKTPHQPNQPTIPTNTDVSEFFDYLLLKTKKNLRMNEARRGIIERRLKDGYTLEQMKKAVDNFVQDPWEGRQNHIDVVYCIGIRNKVDNLEKWLNWTPRKKEEYHKP